MESLENSDACFKGPTTTIPKPNAPKSVAVTLRQKFELYSNIRPVKTFQRLTPDINLNFVCFREATEGLYSGIEVQVSDDSAIAIRQITRNGCKRFVSASIDWARKYNMKKLVAITKRNILKKTDGLFWNVLEEQLKKSPEITLDEIYIDNMTQQMVVNQSHIHI